MVGHAFVQRAPNWQEDVQRLISDSTAPDSFKVGYAASLVTERAVDLFGATEVLDRLRILFAMKP